MSSSGVIAERQLLYSAKGDDRRRPFTIRLMAPVLHRPDQKPFPMEKGSAVCTIAFDGLNEHGFDVHGIDSIHALAQAANVDEYLRGMTSKYEFYWPTGEPYFEDR